MLSRIHEKLGTAGFVLAIVALVAALAGTAIAALPGLNGKQKREVRKIAKKYAGKQGATGPQGPAGSEGKQGPEGKQGAPGVNGDDGEDGACSSANPSCVLPSGATSTGHWAFASDEGSSTFVSISFPLRVIPAPDEFDLTQNWIGPGDSPTSECPGTAKDPKAAPGEVCLYVGTFSGTPVLANVQNDQPTASTNEWTQDRTSGLVFELVFANASAEAYGAGTWAVTAE